MKTTKKSVAKTLTMILENPLMKTIMDRQQKIGPVIDTVLSHWDYDLFSRKPGIAQQVTEDGTTIIETDLDMVSFISALGERNAVINLPDYNARRPETVKENQVSISKDNRHGKLLGTTSNQNTFSFGVRFKDAQVANLLEDEEIGAYRTFLLTDLNGELYEGYDGIEFFPTYEENKWFYEKGIWTDDPNVDGNIIHFKHFVAPQKWLSFYGQHYFIAKALENRLVEQIQYMKEHMAQIQEYGVKFPLKTGRGQYWKDTSHPYGHFDYKKVWEFEAEVDYPDNDSVYPTVAFTQGNLVGINIRVKQLSKSLSKIRYHVRCVELAFANKHNDLDIPSGTPKSFLMPGWIDADWEVNYKQKGKRKMWQRMKLMQPGVGELSVALRFRWIQRKEKIRKGRK